MQRKEFVLEEKYLKYFETQEMFVHAWLLGFVSQSPVNLRLSVGCREIWNSGLQGGAFSIVNNQTIDSFGLSQLD